MDPRHIEISKFLSYVLRHAPQRIGLTLDRDGWASLEALIAAARSAGQDLDADSLRAVVAGNDKQRFALSEDGGRIRAVQGHSTPVVDLQYPPRVPPEVLYHGTATRFLASIRAEGLRPGRRHHVHLSADIDTAIGVGRRHGQPAVLRIDALRLHRDGQPFFQADNGVWLSGPIAPRDLAEVELR
jgi:putative RNA 2'-phosphotransferase